jgi:hypothetical protein
MKLPSRHIGPWTKEIITECSVSREKRRSQYRVWRSVYYNGSDGARARENLCFSHIDKLSSYLFSPSDVRFDVSFEVDETPRWHGAADLVSRHMTREFRRTRSGLLFAQGVDGALVDGCCLLKLTWGARGWHPHLIKPEMFGVMREDKEDLDEQDAFVVSYYLTPAQFARAMNGHPKAKSIIDEVEASNATMQREDFEQDYFHEIVAGGLNPVGTTQSSGQRGSVAFQGRPTATLSPQVAERLIRVDEAWIMNDDARDGQGDWTTIRMAGDLVIDGEYRYRNMCDIPGQNPFIKICPNEVSGYFWGHSEIDTVVGPQMWLNERLEDVDRIFRMQARPARTFTGFSSITDEKARILNAPSGILTDPQAPNAKVETLAPNMPSNAMEYLNMIRSSFEEAGGFTPMTSGHGEPGVRSGAQANTMLKTSSPRLRDRALIVEDQCSAFGDLCLKMSQVKDARVFTQPKRGAFGKINEFMLSQLPDDVQVSVDSHTSSPAFSGDNMQLAFALAARGAIDGEALIKMTHPPYQDELVLSYRDREEARAKFLQQHPELAEQHGKKRKS